MTIGGNSTSGPEKGHSQRVGRMPGFPSIDDAAMTALIRYLVSREDHKLSVKKRLRR